MKNSLETFTDELFNDIISRSSVDLYSIYYRDGIRVSNNDKNGYDLSVKTTDSFLVLALGMKNCKIDMKWIKNLLFITYVQKGLYWIYIYFDRINTESDLEEIEKFLREL